MTKRMKVIDEIVQDITSIKRKLGQKACSFFLKSDLTYTQLMIIKLIDEKKGANIKEIAENLEVTSSAATQQVDSLVKHGYLMRSENEADRRVINLGLTEKTRQRLSEIRTRLREQFVSTFEVLSNEELEQYRILNNKIINCLKQ